MKMPGDSCTCPKTFSGSNSLGGSQPWFLDINQSHLLQQIQVLDVSERDLAIVKNGLILKNS